MDSHFKVRKCEKIDFSDFPAFLTLLFLMNTILQNKIVKFFRSFWSPLSTPQYFYVHFPSFAWSFWTLTPQYFYVHFSSFAWSFWTLKKKIQFIILKVIFFYATTTFSQFEKFDVEFIIFLFVWNFPEPFFLYLFWA